MNSDRIDISQKIKTLDINLPNNFYDHIQTYKQTLLQWNKIHNITGAKDETTLDSFIFDALYPLTFIEPPKTLLDIGTGAGFPGLVLALALPQTQITLAEPLMKRSSFLQFIKVKLGLENVTVKRNKAEELKPQIFELITSRAVTDTALLLQISKKLRNENTKLLFYKGERVFDEVDRSLPHKVIITNNRHYLLIDNSLKELT